MPEGAAEKYPHDALQETLLTPPGVCPNSETPVLTEASARLPTTTLELWCNGHSQQTALPNNSLPEPGEELTGLQNVANTNTQIFSTGCYKLYL
jgi:hypothetical protein